LKLRGSRDSPNIVGPTHPEGCREEAEAFSKMSCESVAKEEGLIDERRTQAQAPSVDGLRSFASSAAAVGDGDRSTVKAPFLDIGERISPWDAMHIAIAEDDELSDAVHAYVLENFAWSERPELRDRLARIVKQGPAVTKTLYRSEPPGDGAPEGGLRGFRSWSANLDTAEYLGHHLGPRDFVIRTTLGYPVKGLSIEDWAYWRGRVVGEAFMGGGKQAEYLVLDSTVTQKALTTDVRGQQADLALDTSATEAPTSMERGELISDLERGRIKLRDLEKGREGRFTTWGTNGKVHAFTQGAMSRKSLLKVLGNNLYPDEHPDDIPY